MDKNKVVDIEIARRARAEQAFKELQVIMQSEDVRRVRRRARVKGLVGTALTGVAIYGSIRLGQYVASRMFR